MWRGLLAESPEVADAVVFGMPFDEHCSVGRGASHAPFVMRECSESLPPYTVSGRLIPPILYDLGDVDGFDYDGALEKMRAGEGKKLTLMLGGDHSVSILTERAYRESRGGRRAIVHIDAHADICDFYDGSHNSHACTNRRALENGFSPEDITMIGIRSYEDQEVEILSRIPLDVYSAQKAAESPDAVADAIIKKYADYDGVYLSFDIDAVDPAYAPGTGTPEAFGIPSATLLYILRRLFAALPIDAMDIVEVSPPLDTNNVTSWLALKYILEILSMISEEI